MEEPRPRYAIRNGNGLPTKNSHPPKKSIEEEVVFSQTKPKSDRGGQIASTSAHHLRVLKY
ncbi:uncharacterized protein M6B38_306880 [Iris pallida]|uniref:Uncharacterized protein n=1 Tax=Iris pallida TaxID=29817 RepID=A0AAX6HKW6_IRIPA|nr:uncharacterized protein M6B38_306880 [Iris pallida]